MIAFNRNELCEIKKIIARHIYTKQVYIPELVKLIEFTCNMTEDEAFSVLADNSLNGAFGTMNWEHIFGHVIDHARADIVFNYNLILLAENWKTLGYKTQKEAVEEMKERMQ